MMGGMIEATDIHKALAALAERRPVFHREADFQHELAWEIRTRHEDIGVRLERPVQLGGKRGYIDIWLNDGPVVIEVKYWPHRADLVLGGEQFVLKENVARDLYRYEFWKDVARVERLISQGHAQRGYVLTVGSDYNYWRPGGEQNIDGEFLMYEGRAAAGTLRWSSRSKERKSPIELMGRHTTHWADYSKVHDGPRGAFRYLLLDIGEGLAAAGRA